jgi:hypothetical protein
MALRKERRRRSAPTAQTGHARKSVWRRARSALDGAFGRVLRVLMPAAFPADVLEVLADAGSHKYDHDRPQD